MHFDLTIVWAGIIVFAIAMYVVMDGFDLGIGILFTRFRVGAERNTAMNAIAPVWDGNETWLVMGGGGLMAAFPLAYAIILPALYAPMIAMLLGLVFRGVAFEFRWRDPNHRARWDAGFCIGSIIAARDQDQRTRLRGRILGLDYAIQRPHRRKPRDRICLAGRLLADMENHGTPSCRGPPPRQAIDSRLAGGDRRGQPLHAVSQHQIL